MSNYEIQRDLINKIREFAEAKIAVQEMQYNRLIHNKVHEDLQDELNHNLDE